MLIYAILTVVCLLLDLVGFFIAVSFYSNEITEFSFAGAALLVFSGLFITLDLYYMVWVFS